MELMHRYEVSELADRIQRAVGDARTPAVTDIDNAFQFAVERFTDEEGYAPNLYNDQARHTLDIWAVENLGFDWDEIFVSADA